MRDVAALLNDMVDAGVILQYALFGAVAQMRYTEPVATLDADVLVELSETSSLDLLAPIYQFCKKRGHVAEGEAVRVGAWPVQFIPTFSELTAEAVSNAETVDFEGIALRVVGPTHLAVIALSVGRAKDWTRVLALLESESVTQDEISRLTARHGLEDAWLLFQERFLDG